MGGVGIVTAAFLDHLGASATLGFNATLVAVVTFTGCVTVLLPGRYALDKVIKAISILLLVGTVGATLGALMHTRFPYPCPGGFNFGAAQNSPFSSPRAAGCRPPSTSVRGSASDPERYKQTGSAQPARCRAGIQPRRLLIVLALCFLLLGALLHHDMALPAGPASPPASSGSTPKSSARGAPLCGIGGLCRHVWHPHRLPRRLQPEFWPRHRRSS